MRQLLTSYLTCVLFSGAFAPIALAQKKVDARMTYERIWAVVPMVGTGAITDPKRPMFAPLPGAVSPSSRTGILGYSFQLSDDGQFALVEFVAAQRSAFKFWDATKAPHDGWKWDGGTGNLAVGAPGAKWYNPLARGETLYPDISPDQMHGKPPHWDYTDPLGDLWECDKAGDIFEKGVQWW